ncbi:hypothetical protein BVX97_02210 [bacterium E08(2017)]|nr:hypothetical protein BVX97_02210 [bacterium E08(2017)]
MINWKKNLFIIWLSQFLSIMGFSFSMSYHWVHMQEVLGVTDPNKLKLYIALFGSAAPISLAIFGPIWGAAADKFGRRLMCLRAYTGAAFFLYLMGITDNIIAFICVRFLQGVLTGTMTAAQALVAVQTPEKHSGFALGTLNSGVYSGAMAGMAVGGICAEYFGTRNAFFISSMILMGATLLMVFGTKEDFEKPKDTPSSDEQEPSTVNHSAAAMAKADKQPSALRKFLPIMLLLTFASFARRFDLAMFPLLVQEIQGSTEGAAMMFGFIMTPATIAGALSGICLGYLADRVKPSALLSTSALLAAVCIFMIGQSQEMLPLFILRFAVSFCIGGFGPVLQSWISDNTAKDRRGRLFGWIASARAAGWVFAPLLSGSVAIIANVRTVFTVGSVIFIALALAIPLISKRIKPSN